MSLDQFSTILLLGSMALWAVSAGALVLSFASRSFRERLQHIDYSWYVYALAAISIGSIIGSLILQLTYLTPVCELCWWQRIFLYPISVVTLVGLWYKTREVHITAGILSVFGFGYASYHYYYHYQGLVLGNTLTLPCSSGGLLPACTDSPILIFGFATIPFMGVMVFASLLAISFLAHRIARKQPGA